MRGLGTGLLLLWIIIHEGSCNYAEILWGQCHAFCLTKYQERLQQTAGLKDVPLNPDSAIQDCKKDRECKWCLFACQRPQKDFNDHGICVTDCQNSSAWHNARKRKSCLDGCRFLARSSESKEGICPPPSEIGSTESPCVHECQKDATCSGMSKCCNTSCGRICHQPDNLHAFPEKPVGVRFKERKDGGLLVKWDKSRSPELTSPVIYILRWWCPYTPEVLYSITTKLRVRLAGYPDGVHPAIRCNYMVASVNIYGSQGFTRPAGYLKKFLHPSPPLNLERTGRKLHGGKVDVSVKWEAPKFTDGMDVDRYLVFWSDGLPRAGTSYMRLHMHRKIVKSTSYTIPSLEPGIMYFVQVRAVVDWKGKTIRGQPASTYIESFSPSLPAEEDVGRLREEFRSKAHVYDIMVDEPFFVDSELKARASWSLYSESSVEKYILYWTLDVCDGEAKHRKTPARLTQQSETSQPEFHMFGLESGCVYELKIHTVNYFGDHGEVRKQFFRTPPCLKTKGRTPDILCKLKASPPLPPHGIGVSFKSTCACQAVVSWHQPDVTMAEADAVRAKAFSVTWGQSRPMSGSRRRAGSMAVVYNAVPHTVTVSGSHSQACMRNLVPGIHYTVQVLSQAGTLKSSPAVTHFTTPVESLPCFRHVYSGDLQRDQSSPADTNIEVVEERKEKDLILNEKTAQVILPPKNVASTLLNNAVFLVVASVIFILSSRTLK